MSNIINTNTVALVSKALAHTERQLTKNYHRMSSGERINYAADDAAGSAISGKMESQIRGIAANVTNLKDGQFLVAAAEAAMEDVTSILQRMREIAVHSSNGTLSNKNVGYLQDEINVLIEEIDAIGVNSKFNNRNILDGSQTFTFYQDMNASGSTINLGGLTVSSEALDVEQSDMNMSSNTSISEAIGKIDEAIQRVDSKRANLGAVHNRFEHGIENLSNVIFNTQAARSRVKDANLAEKTIELTTNNMLADTAKAMIAQANSKKKTILQLIQQ